MMRIIICMNEKEVNFMKTKQRRFLIGILIFFLLLHSVLIMNPTFSFVENHIEQAWLGMFNTFQSEVEADEDIVIIDLGQEKEKYNILYEKDGLGASDDALHYRAYEELFKNQFQEAMAICVLDDYDVEYSNRQVDYVTLFREQKNVFWHRTEKNANALHSKDNCGYVTYHDSVKDFEKMNFAIDSAAPYLRIFCFFEELGISDDENAKTYFPYYYYTLTGNTVKNDIENQRVIITGSDGVKREIPTNTYGYISRKYSDQSHIKVYTFSELSQLTAEEFQGKKVFITSGDKLDALKDANGNPQNVAQFYIDCIATADSGECITYLDTYAKMALILLLTLFLGLIVIYGSTFVSLLCYLAAEFGLLLAHLVLMQTDALYIPVIFAVISSSFVVLLMKIIVVSMRIKGAKAMPMDAILQFTSSLFALADSMDYKQYLREHKDEIEQALSIRILHADEEESGELFTELMDESKRSRRALLGLLNRSDKKNGLLQIRTKRFKGVRYAIFVPLPVFDKELEEQNYTVLGSKTHMKKQAAQYVSTLILSIYIYFKAQNESGRRQETYFAMLKLMVSVIDAKDPITAGHSQRVADISANIGRWLDLDKKTQYDLEFAALLHDIGKVSVSDYVLNKPSLFTRNDFEQMKHHTVRGAEILSEVGLSEDIIMGVRHHHERLDGKGYPDNLTGEELSLFAKIIKIADVYDALTSRRQYKEAWENTKALNIIYNGMGTEFDAYIANIFIKHMKPEGWMPPVKKEEPSAAVCDFFMEQGNRIAEDIYQMYRTCISIEFPMHTRKSDFVDFHADFGFMGYDWGETFNNPPFLANRPMILSYEERTQSLFLGQRCHSDGVENIYYYYFKGFLHLGIYLLDYISVDYIKNMLREHFGEPVVIDERTQGYKGNKYRLLCKQTNDDKTLLYYVSEYLCSNYVFHEANP